MESNNLFLGMDFETAFKILSYIITVGIGGVGYKFAQLLLQDKKDTKEHNEQVSENLITNLEHHINSLTSRVNELEDRREESYKREIDLTKMLAKAEQKVETLEGKVRVLEKNQAVLEKTVNKYYQKYGPLNEAS